MRVAPSRRRGPWLSRPPTEQHVTAKKAHKPPSAEDVARQAAQLSDEEFTRLLTMPPFDGMIPCRQFCEDLLSICRLSGEQRAEVVSRLQTEIGKHRRTDWDNVQKVIESCQLQEANPRMKKSTIAKRLGWTLSKLGTYRKRYGRHVPAHLQRFLHT